MPNSIHTYYLTIRNRVIYSVYALLLVILVPQKLHESKYSVIMFQNFDLVATQSIHKVPFHITFISFRKDMGL